MTASPSEDKTCRMCGYADRSNLNIFQTRQIYKKLIALYPIVLYKSDPLPKNICLKCYGGTLKRYDEFIRISKIQTKWIHNVRNNQPNNPYIKILDKIDETNTKRIETLKKIGDESFDDSFSVIKHSHNQFPDDFSSNTNSQNVNIKTEKSNFLHRFSSPSSNRVLLSHLKNENSYNNVNNKSNGFGCKKLSNSENNQQDNTNLPKNKCRYCCKILPNQKFLAFHQMKFHLGLSVFKSFTRKALPKRLRCGQPIKINNKTCLRCNNCWKCFDNYESILNHWQNKRCEFYCLICGKEFPNNPSPLRKHLKIDHSLDFQSYKVLVMKSRSLIPTKISQNKKMIIKSEGSSPSSLDFRKQTFEFININDKRKIPVLKLKRKTNSEKEEFDIKVEDISASPPYGRSPSDIDLNISVDMNEETMEKPLLRVKNITELQCNPKMEEEPAQEEYVSLDEFKLNTINIESNSPRSIKENFCEEIE